MLLERSGGPYHSKSLPDKPRNNKQIKNRKQKLKSSSKNHKQERQINDELTTLFNVLENENSLNYISRKISILFVLVQRYKKVLLSR